MSIVLRFTKEKRKTLFRFWIHVENWEANISGTSAVRQKSYTARSYQTLNVIISNLFNLNVSVLSSVDDFHRFWKEVFEYKHDRNLNV